MTVIASVGFFVATACSTLMAMFHFEAMFQLQF